MAPDRDEKIALVKRKLTLVNASLSNAANQIKAGKVVTASIIDDLTEQQASLQKQIKHLESSPEAAPSASSPQPSSPANLSPAFMSASASAGDPSGEGGASDPESGEDPDPDKRALLEKFAVRPRKYHMSEAALAQRRKACKSPAVSEALKGNTNAWKTGENARSFVARVFRPCLSTCPQYPCELIAEGETAPGSVCLDKKEFVKGLMAVQKAMRDGKLDDLKDVMSLRIAGNIDILGMLQQDIMENGVNSLSEKIDKDGNIIGHELKLRPALLALPKMTEVTGATPMNQMVDPREIKRAKTEQKKAKALSNWMSGLGMGEAPGEEEEVETAEGAAE